MADSESDVDTEGLESALDSLCNRHCSDESSLKSKNYCSEFCELVEEYTGQWQVPLPQLMVLRTALCSFTKATAAFPDDCQHIHYVLSSLALSFFELMLFFSKEEFVEDPLKDILDSFQECHTQLLRHRNGYFQQVKLVIKAGGPWENPVLQRILKEADLQSKDVEEYLSSELPVFLELRVRYLQACEKLQEAMALSKSCLENSEAGKHLFFHQAYLTCLYKASLHDHLHKEMAVIDGRDAVEIICNTERVEKDELLLSLCKTFLTQYLHNGDMYYIWDLVFIWSRLHLRAHSSRPGFLAECLTLASSATNVRAIFPFIKLVTTEVGGDGIEVCVELCARALHLCDIQADSVTRSLVCKTIAFLLPHDLEICRACALLVFCQERSLEAYRTVCILYMHPDQDQNPHSSHVRTNVRFHILQMLKERLCFDPEFWNILTLRSHCLELISDSVLKAAVLNEMMEEEKVYSEELSTNCLNEPCTQDVSVPQCTEVTLVNQDPPEEQIVDEQARQCVSPSNNAPLKRRKRRRRLRKRKHAVSDDEAEPGDDPEFKYNLQSTLPANKPMYSLRRTHTKMDSSASAKLPLNRKREYLSRCVKSQILKRKGRKRRWLQGLPKLEQVQTVLEKLVKVKGKKRGRKPLVKVEFSYPDNEIFLSGDESGFEEKPDTDNKELDVPHLDNELKPKSEDKENQLESLKDLGDESGPVKDTDMVCVNSDSEHTQEESETQPDSKLNEGPPSEIPAVEGDPELDGPLLELMDCPIELQHCYSLTFRNPDGDELQESIAPDEINGDSEQEPQPPMETEVSKTKPKIKRTWKDRLLRTRQFAHMMHHCNICRKDYKGLNIMRHALSHLKSKRLRCILCGKRFKQFSFAKKHVLDHFDEMYKPTDKKPRTEDTPLANGVVVNEENPNQPQIENQTSIAKEEIPERKTGGKVKVSSLKREERIIRNIRTLIKKTSVLHKKCKSPNSNIFKKVEFQDEQVVIKDGLVIIKDPSVIERNSQDEEGKDNPVGENGCGLDITYHLCPSETCDRVFLRTSSTLIKHAIKCHIKEDNVLEKTFVWAKHKCTLCLRQFQFFQNYKDHMKLHDDPLQHFCYHLDCSQRFMTQQEIKDHIRTHEPFRPQCPFADCEKLFSTLHPGLYDHEWRHYIPAPQREEMELAASRQKNQSADAPWKQRVKVEELWLQNKKEQRDSSTPHHVEALNLEELGEMSKTAAQHCDVNDQSGGEVYYEPSEDNKHTPINGYEEEVSDSATSTSLGAAATTPDKKSRKRMPVQVDPLNVKDLEHLSTLSEGAQQRLGEPHITEHKTFKPEDPTYATFVKAPFIRPPPSTYLDESVLSMRKRRSTEAAAPRKNIYWNSKKKETEPEKAKDVVNVISQTKVRHRCDKCLSFFSSLEELTKHQALKNCSSLFGFDSDDES
nr:uncharacterized protein LOC122758381 [Solea senegalensis]